MQDLKNRTSRPLASPGRPTVNIIHQLGSMFRLNANEVNGWGQQGYTDESLTIDLGNVGDANLSRQAGGLSFPFDVRVMRMYVVHTNSDALAQAWGWVLARQEKQDNNNAVTTTFILDESTDRGFGNNNGLRDYGNNNNQITDIDLSNYQNNVLISGEVLCLGVGAPTAAATNYDVRVASGYISLERV